MKNIISRLSPLKIALFYACIGGLWLLLNISMLVANLVLERDFLHAIEIQSVLLILVTSWVLYVLIVRTRNDSLSGKLEPLNRLVRALKAYSECHQSLIRATDEKQLMNDICRIFIEVGGYRMAWVGTTVDDSEKTITPVAGWGDNTEFIDIFKSTCMNKDMGLGPIPQVPIPLMTKKLLS